MFYVLLVHLGYKFRDIKIVALELLSLKGLVKFILASNTIPHLIRKRNIILGV